MMDQYLRGKPLKDPGMSQSFIWGHAPCRVPMKTSLNEVNEWLIIAFKDLIKVLRGRLPDLAPLAWNKYWSAIILEELLPSLTIFEHIRAWHTAYLHHHGKLFHLVLTWEKRKTYAEFRHDASEAPHVDGTSIWNTQDDLGCSVKSRLDVCVNSLILEARAAEIYDFDAWLGWILEQNVFRLQVAMNNLIFLQILQGIEELYGKSSH